MYGGVPNPFMYLVMLAWVFPMCMGVFPMPIQAQRRNRRLPHVYGGVPVATVLLYSHDESSPCVWGCSHYQQCCFHSVGVFPMCMGVFQILGCTWSCWPYLSHTDGSVSWQAKGMATGELLFPFKWECSRYSRYALKGISHGTRNHFNLFFFLGILA